jgi:CheY-like chemotaxis protein
METTAPKDHLVYIVDDDEDDKLFIRAAFEKLVPDLALKLFSNGRELIAEFQKNGRLFPDFILMDLNMPVMCGLDALKWIRSHAPSEIPVIIFSTSSNKEDIALCYESGANGYISKPNRFGLYEQIALKLKEKWIK